MDRKSAIKLNSAELASMFADDQWSQAFPPVLTVKAASELAGVPIATVYDWSSRGLLNGCACRKGKRLRILRDRFIQYLFSE